MRVYVCTSEYIGMCIGHLGFILYSWHVSNRKLQEQAKNLVQKSRKNCSYSRYAT